MIDHYQFASRFPVRNEIKNKKQTNKPKKLSWTFKSPVWISQCWTSDDRADDGRSRQREKKGRSQSSKEEIQLDGQHVVVTR
jgi:hypothetical protein